jgi:ABC-2 type transport system permease protein
MSKTGKHPTEPLHTLAVSLFHQIAVEFRLFWRSRQTIYLAFLVPMLGMALFVYLNREGMLESVFGALFRGLGQGETMLSDTSPMTLMTLGLIVYCIIDVAFESAVPKLVRERSAGIYKRLGGTPLQRWVFLMAKTGSATFIICIEVALILVVGRVSTDIAVGGSWWLLGLILLLGTFATAALGFVLSNVTASADGAVVAVHAIYIPMLFLCGAFIPVEALPKVLQAMARAIPLTYFVGPFRSVMTQGAGLGAIAGDLLILLAWTVAAWIAAVRTFRWE